MQKYLFFVFFLFFSFSHAEEVENKLVIQVSSNDPITQNLALNNVVNVQKHFGIDNVEIEVVAYGPGISLLTQKNKHSTRIKSLIFQDVVFSACGNTLSNIKRKKGKEPKLTKGVKIIKAGIPRIMYLQKQGYSYVRP